MYRCMSAVYSLVVLISCFSSVIGWGRDGHELVAHIAQSLLTNETSEFVRLHLPFEVNGTMSNVSTWADNILYADTEPNYQNWQWSAALHYVNTEDWTCVYNRQMDCNWTSSRVCVDGAIQNFTERLANPQLDPIHLQEALQFLIHFIGDVHQPLHGGFASDRGGNSIRGDFFGRTVNFHSLWDTAMIQRKINNDFQSQSSYLQYLIAQMNGRYAQNITEWTNCSYLDDSRYHACSATWVQEDAELSCSVVYRDENNQQITSETGFNITETYYNTRMDTVELRLIQAGVRLAAVINEVVKVKYTEDNSNGAHHVMPSTRLSFVLIALISIYIVLLT